jgi:putative ABC transport system permease protein
MPEWEREVRQRLAGLRLEPTRESEIVEELAQHLEDRYTELRATGATEAEAARAALTELSEHASLARELRRVERQDAPEPIMLGTQRRTKMLADLWQDLRFGARMLLKQPGFSLIAVVTLALGIGANTAIFSVVNGALLKPLPYPGPQQLVRLFERVERTTMASDRMEVAPANFLDWREQSTSFSGLAVYALTGLALAADGTAERIEGALASADFFAVMGVPPLVGRTFTAEDERGGDRFMAVISFDLWQRRFGGAREIVGRAIDLDGYRFTIVGVMPPGFGYPHRTELWELWRLNANQRQMREARFLKVIARLKPGVTLAQAQTEMAGIAQRLSQQYPQTNRNWGASVVPLLKEEVGKIELALLVLFGAVALVLLIACANVASLMLARGAARQAEIGVRLALGAAPWRIVRQLLTESLLLAGAGGLLGLLIGVWGLHTLLALAPENLPRMGEVRLDARVFGFTLLVALLTGILFGLAPAWQAARQDVQQALKEGAGRVSNQRRRLFNLLVAAELALALVVLTSAGLLAGSFYRVLRVEPGVDVERLLTVEFEPPSARYNGPDWKAQRLNFWQQLSARVAALPGVEAVGAVDSLPFSSGGGRVWSFRREGDDPNVAAKPAASFQVATRDYFRTVGIQLRRGRFFTAADEDGAPPVVIVNETMVRRFWPDAEAVGQRIVIRNETFAREIIGVTSDVKQFGLERETAPEMYVPFEQRVIDVMPLLIRVKPGWGDPARLSSAVRAQVQAVDPTVAVAAITPMTRLLADSLAPRRFTLLLLGAFAGLALLLAGGGVYGVMAYAVSERTQEIGVRLALGARGPDVLRMVLAQGLRLALSGVLLGLGGALALTRLLKTLLFGVSATDPLTFTAIALLLLVVALLACYVPARRATKVDPLIALRSQ